MERSARGHRLAALGYAATVKRAPFEPGREWRTVDAIHRRELSMPQKSMLIAIAKHESRRQRVCFASIRTLAADVGCNEKTARYALHELAEGKIIRIRNIRGSSSRIVINWKAFAKLPLTTPPKLGRGVGRRIPLPKVGGVPLPNQGGGTPPELGSRGVKNFKGCGMEGAARIDGAKHIEHLADTLEKSVQPPTLLLSEIAEKKNHRPPAWVNGELAEDLYRG